MSSLTRGLLPLVAVLAAACAWQAQSLPEPVSQPHAGTGRLWAGAAMKDITPPAGLGLSGSGPESRRSTGYRTRIYARALYLEDATGERMALVVLDLAHVSANLHRLAAAILAERIGLGADRLIVSATHTHSGPAHFYGERQYNANVSRVKGYDPRWALFLSRRIADAVVAAYEARRPAVAVGGTIPVVGSTWNRSMQAFCANPGRDATCSKSDPVHQVDSMLVMLRVDGVDRASGVTQPLASYSVFAIHGTGVPSLNTLVDGDVQVRIVRQLAERVDPANRFHAIHILANGTEGDVAPLLQRDPACQVPRVAVSDPFPMPRGSGEALDFLEPVEHKTAACLNAELAKLDLVADSVARRAAELYRQLGDSLSENVLIRRAFSTEWLPGNDGLCVAPVLGSATAAGAEGAEPRTRGWRWVFWPVLKLGFEEGKSAIKPKPGRCQSPKRELLSPFGRVVIGEHGLPEMAQLSVVQIGNLLFGSVPAEVTTTAGDSIRATMRARFDTLKWKPVGIALIGLANGFLQYVPTRAEYSKQNYEGGSDMYGPGTAGFLAQRLGALAGSLSAGTGAPSPHADVGPIIAYPGPASELMAQPSRSGKTVGYQLVLRCEAGRLVSDVYDLPPGDLFPRDSALLQLVVEGAGEGQPIARDGDGYLEVHAVGKKGNAFLWQAKWRKVPEGGLRYRLERLGEDGRPERSSNSASCTKGS